uniref:Uncharacterized protein n=1 Tax=Solanum tuberosum TaxID=4113 RepID=M1CJ67_SOLTU
MVVGPICQRLLTALAESKERRRVSLVARGCSRRSKGDEELTWSSLASIFAEEEGLGVSRRGGEQAARGFSGACWTKMEEVAIFAGK